MTAVRTADLRRRIVGLVSKIADLIARGYRVTAWDPRGSERVWSERFVGAERHETREEATRDTTVVLILMEWPEVVHANWPTIRAATA